ncbi:MAG: hypothetical protein Q9163_002156 [Psora crenata]
MPPVLTSHLPARVSAGLPIPDHWPKLGPRSNISPTGNNGGPAYVPGSVQFWMFLMLSLALMPFLALFPILLSGFLCLNQAQLELLKQAGVPKHRDYAARILKLRIHTFTVASSLLLSSTAVSLILAMLISSIIGPSNAVEAGVIPSLVALITGQLLPIAVPSITLFEVAGLLATPIWWVSTLLLPAAWCLGFFLRMLNTILDRRGDIMDGLMKLPELIEWVRLHKRSAKHGGQLDDELVDMWCAEMQEELDRVLRKEKKWKGAETRKTV